MSGHLLGTYGPTKATFVAGEGSWLFDEAGKAHLDLLSGIAVTSLGHAHPELAEAISTQAKTLLHTSNFFDTRIAEQVATGLCRVVSDGGPANGKVFFANSGAEATEAAIKIVRRAKGPSGAIVAAIGSFHGRTYGALSATGQPTKQAPFLPLLPGFTHVPYGDLAALEAVFVEQEVAALLLEPIMGEGGVITPPAGYLVAAAELAASHGALLVLDEVQTGIGRTGRWCAFQHDGLSPDLVTFAKALGNGVPVGACWVSDRLAEVMQPGDHGSTFGGQPLAMAAARCVLEIVERDGLVARAADLGATLAEGLAGLPGVVELRGRGLLMGVELEAPVAAAAVDAGLAAGVVLNAVRPSTLRLAPPLTLTDDEATEALARTAAAIAVAMEEVQP